MHCDAVTRDAKRVVGRGLLEEVARSELSSEKIARLVEREARPGHLPWQDRFRLVVLDVAMCTCIQCNT